MNSSKYLIIDCNGIECSVVFSHLFTHNQFGLGKNVISGGFCYRNQHGSYQVYGKSVSMNVESRPEDARILDELLETEY